MTVVLVVDSPTMAHLARALSAHARWCRANRVPFPADLARLADALAASTGPGRTPRDGHDEPPDAAPVPLLLDSEAAARQLAVSERQLRRLVSDGDLKAVRIGRSVRFAPDDLTSFVESRRANDDGG